MMHCGKYKYKYKYKCKQLKCNAKGCWLKEYKGLRGRQMFLIYIMKCGTKVKYCEKTPKQFNSTFQSVQLPWARR